ncbi:glycosyltransferase [bacterium]|nr:MAG: glycosyltransferase [bacterium]
MPQNPPAVAYCAHDDHWLLEPSIMSFKRGGDVYVFVSRMPWNGEAGEWQRTVELAESAGATVILGDWPTEILHREAARQRLIERGYVYAFLPDSDEVIDSSLLDSLGKVARESLAQRVYVHMDTYWKSEEYVIRPREQLTPLLLVELANVSPTVSDERFTGRLYQGGKALLLSPDFGVIHHLSYAGPDERIWRKITTWSHSAEVVPDWWRRVWQAWDRDPMMRGLHPTAPPAYGFAERIVPPACLESVPRFRSRIEPLTPPPNWPKVSVVVPLYGGEDDIRACLASLEKCSNLIHETIVVDDVSPDSAAEAAEEFSIARVFRNERNLGFAGTCNRGYRKTTGDIVVFLNSDTIVPRSGLIRLIESLTRSGTIGAAGPLTTTAGASSASIRRSPVSTPSICSPTSTPGAKLPTPMCPCSSASVSRCGEPCSKRSASSTRASSRACTRTTISATASCERATGSWSRRGPTSITRGTGPSTVWRRIPGDS